MTSQSSLMVAARIDRTAVKGLRALLSTMNGAPGQADPANSLVPFGKLENAHFVRFLILDDATLDDIRLYGLPRVEYPLYLTLFCDFDGGKPQFLSELVACAEPGLRLIFSYCDDFRDGVDLLQWLRDHDLPIAANYTNWPGRTVRQIREEARLRQFIGASLRANPAMDGRSPEQIRKYAGQIVETEKAAGRLTLTPPAPTPWSAKIGSAAHAIGAGLLILTLSPLVGLLLVFRIRPMEKTDAVFAPRPDPELEASLGLIEDRETTNQFSAMGSLKPGRTRLWVVRFVLLVIAYTARHLYTKGRLARVRTIHSARWVFLDDKKRILFGSNYDGSLDSYMDDFIDKVFFGLNVIFGNGVGYPRTRWLLFDGATDEQKFKYFLRRHQLPTEVWFHAFPGMTAIELERNSRVRDGLEAASLSEEKAREWLQLL